MLIEDGSTAELREQDRVHHLHPWTNPVTLERAGPDMITHAEGIYLYTSDGREILDIGSGLGNVALGYGNRRICEAAYRTMQQLSFAHTMFGHSNPWVAGLSAKLADITPAQFQHFAFAASGSEANETALKLALRFWRLQGKPDKRVILSRRRSYHGGTLFAGGLGTGADDTQVGLPVTDMIKYIDPPYWYVDGHNASIKEYGIDVANELESRIQAIGPSNIAALICDVIQTGGGGYIVPPETYWPRVREICDRYEILLIADEVVSGFGKTGEMFGFQAFDFEPDLFTMAKALSSGYFPISSVAVGDRVSDVLQEDDELFYHVFTNSGHPVGAAVALEVIAIIEEERLVERVRDRIGPYFRARLEELLDLPCVGEVRSVGGMGAIQFDLERIERPSSDADLAEFGRRMVESAWRRGVAIRGSGLTLPLIITESQIDAGLAVIREAIVDASS